MMDWCDGESAAAASMHNGSGGMGQPSVLQELPLDLLLSRVLMLLSVGDLCAAACVCKRLTLATSAEVGTPMWPHQEQR
jgi:hypothetical protein